MAVHESTDIKTFLGFVDERTCLWILINVFIKTRVARRVIAIQQQMDPSWL